MTDEPTAGREPVGDAADDEHEDDEHEVDELDEYEDDELDEYEDDEELEDDELEDEGFEDDDDAWEYQGPLVRSGFVTIVGRPNVGKSTLVNRIVGEKVSIVSDKPQTTRFAVRGVLHRPGAQIVFVDTPGIHKPVTALGERLNAAADEALDGVDVVCLLVDARSGLGSGDRLLAQRVGPKAICILNKIDGLSRTRVLEQLTAASELGLEAYFPVSARTGDGVDALVEHLVAALPEGPPYYPEDMVTDTSAAAWVAELVREQLLAVTRDELPHSIVTRVTDWEERRVRCEILVERESQKGMVIGKGGSVLKRVGTAVRAQLPEGTHLELAVRVEPNWQRRAAALDRLGY